MRDKNKGQVITARKRGEKAERLSGKAIDMGCYARHWTVNRLLLLLKTLLGAAIESTIQLLVVEEASLGGSS
jgi:hypothetical protein